MKAQLELVKAQLELARMFNIVSSFDKLCIQKYYQNESKFNSVCSRKNGTYEINLDEFKSIGSHLIALYVNVNNISYFDSFGLGHIPKQI